MNTDFWQTLQSVLIITLFSIVLVLGPVGNLFSGSTMSCTNRCVHTHPQWGQFACSEGEEYYIVGEKCYEIQNECFLECHILLNDRIEVFTPSEQQTTNQWRQKKACSLDTRKLPLEVLPGDHLIESDWEGQCECLNGNLFIGKCGHNELSCDQACSGIAF